MLLPLVPLYGAGLALRELRLQRGWERVRRLRYPVISVGNLSTGGQGKTPFAIAVARLLGAHGFRVDVLTRGYGRSSREPMRVDAAGTADQFGDEPLLIARQAGVPVYVAEERFEAGQLAEAGASDEGNRVHILDDGFQHRQLARDIDILLTSREDWHDDLLPAGNLRENPRAASRADAIAIPANDPEFESEIRASGWSGPVWRVKRRVEVPQMEAPVVAFCGIAKPEQFFEGLRAAGMRVAAVRAFPDHHRFTKRDVASLVAKTREAGGGALITTEKDEVRLGDLCSAFPPDIQVRTAGLSIEVEDENAMVDWIEAELAAGGATASL